MNSLREQIGSAVHDARHGMDIDTATDRILALIAEAMLSEEAVEAAARATHSTEHLLIGEWGPLTEREELDKRVIDKEAKDGYRYAARLSNKAALAAAGITKEGASE